MYEALLRRMAPDALAGGPCVAALESHVLNSQKFAPLLLLAEIHRMVLEGRLPEVARFYPSVSGSLAVDELWPHFLEAVPHAIVAECVQTNEISRSRALLPGFIEAARHTGLPLRLLEIGASAGDHFPFLDMPRTVPIVERRGCDLNPIDPTLDQGRMTMLSIIWADQTDRFQQLAEVIEIAGRVPAPVDRCNAAERPGVATVVFHSIVMPYLAEERREKFRCVKPLVAAPPLTPRSRGSQWSRAANSVTAI